MCRINHRICVFLCSFVALLAFCFIRSARYPHAFSSTKPECWIRCHEPPTIGTLADLVDKLRTSINPRLNWLDRGSGFFTTPIFKMSGIQGWRNYGVDVAVEGEMRQMTHSLDGMTTLDLEVRRLSMAGDVSPLIIHRFLRVELFRSAQQGAKTRLSAGDQVEIYGRLMWDGDGFIEVHPSAADEIRVLRSALQ